MRNKQFFLTRLLKRWCTGKEKKEERIKIEDEKPSNLFLVDEPLSDPHFDRFHRKEFAEHIADSLAHKKETQSLILAINGSWGEGKSSIINFIEKRLKEYSHILSIRFNPWRYKDENEIFKNFFQTLAEGLHRSLENKKEKIGEFLENYADALSQIPLPGMGFLQNSVKGVGKSLRSLSLEERRQHIEKFLREQKKHIVIFIDDIDRLDKDELQLLFRTIKLCADFPYTSYVLAFDKQIIASALAEKYGIGKIHEGYQFLEKIIHVPLNIPKIHKVDLREFCLERVWYALEGAHIQLKGEQIRRFGENFISGLEARLYTPRLAIQYGNQLFFALPLLRGQVDPVDHMLIEGMRTFYPTLYEKIRDNPDLFLAYDLSQYQNQEDLDSVKKRIHDEITKSLEGLKAEEITSAWKLLKALFPRLRVVDGEISLEELSEKQWLQDQNIASRYCFDRFFSYTARETDINEEEIDTFLQEILTKSETDLTGSLRQLMQDKSAESLIEKLQSREAEIAPEVAKKLAPALVRCGTLTPPRFAFSSAFSQAISLSVDLVHKMAQNDASEQKDGEKQALVKEIVLQAQPLIFAAEFLKLLFSSEKKYQQALIFSEEEKKELWQILTQRIRQAARTQDFLDKFQRDLPLFLDLWAEHSTIEEVRDYLKKTLSNDPKKVMALLKGYFASIAFYEKTSEKKRMNTANKGEKEFSLHQYKALTTLIDPEELIAALKKVFPGPMTAFEKNSRNPGSYLQSALKSVENAASQEEALLYEFLVASLETLSSKKISK